MSKKTLIEMMSDEDFAKWMGEDKSAEPISGTPLTEGGIPAPTKDTESMGGGDGENNS